MKIIIQVDPKTGEVDHFFWDEKRDPPPLIKPKIKKRNSNEQKEEKEEA